MKLDDLEAFVRVAERGSFSAAARASGVPKSTLSRRVQRLEEALGLTLIQRAGRTWALTEDGKLLASRSRGPLQELADVRHALIDARDLPLGTLRVSIPIEFAGSPSFATILRDYRRSYPDVVVELQVDGRLVDLVDDSIDVALRGHTGQLAPRAGLIVRLLAAMEGGLVASPAYLDEHGRPESLAELQGHDLIAPSSAVFGPAWPFSSASGGKALNFEPRPGLRSNDFRSLLSAAVAGMGIGGVPLFIANDALDDGRVERVLPSRSFAMGSLSALWPRARNLSPKIRTFVDFLVERLVPLLTPPTR